MGGARTPSSAASDTKGGPNDHGGQTLGEAFVHLPAEASQPHCRLAALNVRARYPRRSLYQPIGIRVGDPSSVNPNLTVFCSKFCRPRFRRARSCPLCIALFLSRPSHLKADAGNRVQGVEKVEGGSVQPERLPDRDGSKLVARADEVGAHAGERGVLSDEGFVDRPDRQSGGRGGRKVHEKGGDATQLFPRRTYVDPF